MQVLPDFKKMIQYITLYSLVIWFLFIKHQVDNSSLVLSIIISLNIIIAVIRFLLLKKKNIKIENVQLFINGTPVSVSYRFKWLAFIGLDYITYENSPWKTSVSGRLDRYMFSKQQWVSLKSLAQKPIKTI